jgi:hypothetical protein
VYYDVRGDVLKIVVRWPQILTQIINTIRKTGEWPKDFSDVTIIALNKKRKATNFSDNHTITINVHTANIVVRILRKKFERKVEDVLGGD